MEDNTRYELLILKEFEGSINHAEKLELNEWLLENENQIFYQEYKKLWSSVDDLHKMKRINKERALRKVEAVLFKNPFLIRLKKLERVAAILFIPLLLASFLLLFNHHRVTNNDLVCNTVSVPLGLKSSLVLPDGTKVWLNAGSQITYPVNFEKDERRVELIGEGFFEVEKSKEWPFIVHTTDIDIKVLGTIFNCAAYSSDREVETALIEGKVELTCSAFSQKVEMEPGELVVYSKINNKLKKGKTDLDKYVAWRSGKLMFRDDSMGRIIEKLGRWYGVQFQIEDQEILDYVYSATFSDESLDQVLKMLSLSAPIEFEILPREKNIDSTYKPQKINLKKRIEMN
ncbi:FecR family protein [Sunxiuqinia sp. A32]|uniref:FecR family protein n=1 Tax=Sunxiuqinia sp. A32 TaxID=3461496 RepID=UPI004046631D